MIIKISRGQLFNNIIEYLFVLILIINCATMWAYYEDTTINYILRVAIIIIVIMYMISNHKIPRSDLTNIILFGGLAMLYFLIYCVAVGYRMVAFLYFIVDAFCIFIFVVIAARNDRGIKILYKYENIILLVAVVSLFFWIFGSILGLITPTGTVYFTWSGSGSTRVAPSYYNIYFETQKLYGITRNTGIFTEAPMFNFNLCIALLVDLFCREKCSKWKCGIFIVTILTTISTTGYCMMIIALIAKFIFSRNEKGKRLNIRLIVIPTIIVLGIIVVSLLLFNRLNSGSGRIRIDDFIAGFKAWLHYPIFGSGYGNNSVIQQYMSSFRSGNQGFSNSPMQILAQGGILFFLPYVYFGYKWIKNCIKKNLQWIVFFACFAFIFIITVVPYRFLTLFLFMAYPFIEDKEKDSVPSSKLNL